MKLKGLSGGQYRPLTEEQIKTIHEASLSILEKTGFTFETRLEAAVDLFDLGLNITCVADVFEDGHDSIWVVELKKRNISFFTGWVARQANGRKLLKSVTLGEVKWYATSRFMCDTLVTSAGLTHLTGPLTLSGASPKFDDHTGFFLPYTLPANMYSAGRILGLHDPLSIEISGRLAGLRAVADCGKKVEIKIKEEGTA